MYDFDTPAPRAGTGAIKWDLRQSAFGNGGALPFWVADSDYMSPPEVVEALQAAAKNCVFGYTAPTQRYKDAVAGWIGRRHGWQIDTGWIVPSTGIVSELSNIVRCFTEKGDKVLIQTPVYDPFAGVVRDAGRTLVENRLLHDEDLRYTMDFEELARQLSAGVKMMLLCSPHNPVGRVWTREEVCRVAALCREYGVLLVSDEIHWDILMPGHAHFSAGSAGTDGNVIVLCAPSKTFNVAGLKCSNDIIPNAALRERLTKWKESFHMEGPNNMGLAACEAAYTYGGRWCDEQNAYLWENAALVRETFARELPEVRIAPLEGTYLMWLEISKTGLGSRAVCEKLNRAGAILNDGWRYGDDSFVRLNIACPRAQLRAGLDVMVDCLAGELKP